MHICDDLLNQIERPVENSPIAISDSGQRLIGTFVADTPNKEISWCVDGIESFIKAGVAPHAIMVVVVDDRNARTYLKALVSQLSERGYPANNLLADPYSQPPFAIDGMVSLSTVYRAKGNEAAVVFVLGIDALNPKSRGDRNKIFTAFTRSKAWLRVSGVGQRAAAYMREIDKAIATLPFLEFTMPDLKRVELIQRDLGKRTARIKRAKEKFLKQLADIGVSEDEVELYIDQFDHEDKRLQ